MECQIDNQVFEVHLDFGGLKTLARFVSGNPKSTKSGL